MAEIKFRSRLGGTWSTETKVGASIVGVVVLAALVGPLLSPWEPNAPDVLGSLEPPSFAHWMGTDSVGRDVLTRTLVGTQISLLAGVLVTIATVVIGTIIGIFAAWRRGSAEVLTGR